MEKFALIGKTLKHSYSKKIHPLLGKYDYDMIELAPESVKDFVLNNKYKGYNITIPYKKDVIPFLDEIDERAKKIGAVNTVVNRDGKKIGFNTDFDGMIYMLSRAGITVKDKNVLILGSGGTSNTARAVCEHLNAKSIKILSRSGEVNYDNYKETAKDSQVIINTTPVGMFPENYDCKIELSAFKNLSGVADAVYNPKLTMLLYQAKTLGVPYSNGFPMLVAQAKFAKEHFFNQKVDDGIIDKIVKTLSSEIENVVLIGMPGCGKSTVGKMLAEKLNLEFIDTDQEIVKKDGRDIPKIFSESGEEYFRSLEKQVLREVGKLSGKVISTGGGVVKDEENYFPLKQNGVIFWIDREISCLASSGRPLSSDRAAIEKLYEERKGLYSRFADFKIDNNGELEKTVKGVIDNL